MLLSVKNLENFNRNQPRKNEHTTTENNPNIILKSNYYLNYFLNQETNRFPIYDDHRWKMMQNIKSVTSLNANNNIFEDGKNFTSMQVKDVDQLSTTSSTTTTNFTGEFYGLKIFNES